MESNIVCTPRIAIVYDKNHSDQKEIAIRRKIESIEPLNKIVVLSENRMLEQKSLNQYSLELLNSDKLLSTSSSCLLLMTHLLIGSGCNEYFGSLLGVIYSDAYFKKLFTEGHYKKCTPEKYGANGSLIWNHCTQQMQNTVQNILGLYEFLDRELPQQPINKQEEFFNGHLLACAKALIEKNQFEIGILAPISKALAVIKIDQIQKRLGDKFDSSNEISLELVENIFKSDSQTTGNYMEFLNKKLRTQFQVQKVIKVVNQITKKNSDCIFVVRVGAGHKEIMTKMLQEHFGASQLKEVVLYHSSLDNVEQEIKKAFEI